jgi:hypothetical protein
VFSRTAILAPQNSGDADTAYTSATSTLGSDHAPISAVLIASRALNRMFTDERDCVS